jgi:hypothetical protein
VNTILRNRESKAARREIGLPKLNLVFRAIAEAHSSRGHRRPALAA